MTALRAYWLYREITGRCPINKLLEITLPLKKPKRLMIITGIKGHIKSHKGYISQVMKNERVMSRKSKSVAELRVNR